VGIEDVTFGYEQDRPVLKSILCEAQPGEMIALVGPTGAGKTTLVSLIPRFYDPWFGRITFNGIDIKSARLESVRSCIALLPQEPSIFPLSVAENIAFGRPNATIGQIKVAAEAASASEFIERLPNGYDTVIGERGSTLSGGQRQRLAIARAVLKAAPILILDEPTSALDSETETLLMQSLGVLMKKRTSFVIAHRLSTVRKADQILVINDGCIVERGVHSELMSGGGLYASFCQHLFQPSEAQEEAKS
jgi:ATP-binding cassette subfamily B protein/subfamily B ATP-binding cassette protein MsbA